MQAIETVYDGFRFRSRLEARWAVFFNAGHIKYEYEPEGYTLDDGTKYLPDFYLPDFDCHVEVKRNTQEGVNEVKTKCYQSVVWGGPIKQLLILSDVPEGRSLDGGIWHFPVIYWKARDAVYGWWYFYDDDGDYIKGKVSRSDYIPPDYFIFNDHFKSVKETIRAVSDEEIRPRILRQNYNQPVEEKILTQEAFNSHTFDAYKAARAARFEHGETPNV